MAKVKDYNNFIKVVEIPKTEIRKVGIFQCNGLETPLQWYNRQTDKPYLVTNCGFFSWNDKLKKFEPSFTLKINNKILTKDSLYVGLGIHNNELSMGHIDALICEDFVSAAPPILQDSKNMVTQAWIDTLSDIAGKNPRTIVGYNNSSVTVGVVDGRQKNKFGLALSELPQLCINIGMTNAVNFDGGDSSMTVVNGNIINSPSGIRQVYSVFAIWLKEDNVEYREPNWDWISSDFAQVTKEGIIKVQNSVYQWAKENAEREGWAVWEKATRKMLFPKVITPIPPQPVPNDKGAEAIALLERIVVDIQTLLKKGG